MLTPQEVEARVFQKAKKSGYDMKEVDDFLDQITADYSELHKENAVLKRKMKVLADKITEYQETEGAMRATLLAAQKMASQMVDEAEQKKTAVLSEAEKVAQQRMDELTGKIAAEEAKLAAAQKSVAALTGKIRTFLEREQQFLDELPDMEVEIAPAQADPESGVAAEAAEEISDSIRRMLAEEAAPQDADAQEQPQSGETAQEAPAEADEPTGPIHRDTDDISDAPTRRMDLSELRFGKNYEIT